MSVDPLSAESLSQVPEVRAAYDAVDELFHDFHRRCTVGAERLDALLAAVRDATLAALVSQTPEAVVEEAAKAMWDSRGLVLDNVPGTVGPMWLGADSFRDLVRAALPVLLGPEVAKREQVEEEVKDLNERGWELDSKLRAAEAEATRGSTTSGTRWSGARPPTT